MHVRNLLNATRIILKFGKTSDVNILNFTKKYIYSFWQNYADEHKQRLCSNENLAIKYF